jgi:hypothetical protein
MITIFIIYHSELEDTNIFTTDQTKISEIIKQMETKYPDTNGQWKYKTIIEGKEFQADFT